MDSLMAAMLEFPRGRDVVLRARNFAMRVIMSVLLLIGAITVAQAQSDYPSRPVRLIVPSEPGGGTDISARILGERLSQAMGQQFVIENRPGAGQMIGTEQVAR